MKYQSIISILTLIMFYNCFAAIKKDYLTKEQREEYERIKKIYEWGTGIDVQCKYAEEMQRFINGLDDDYQVGFRGFEQHWLDRHKRRLELRQEVIYFTEKSKSL